MEYKHSHYLSNYRHLVPKSYNGLPLTPSAPAQRPLTPQQRHVYPDDYQGSRSLHSHES